MDKSYCEKNKCPWLTTHVCMGVSTKICSSPNDIHNGKCDFDNGILPYKNNPIYTLYDVLSLCEFSGCEVYKFTHSEGRYIRISPKETKNLWSAPVKIIKTSLNYKDTLAIFCDDEYNGAESLKDLICESKYRIVDFNGNEDVFSDDHFESMWVENNEIVIRTFNGC